MHLPLDPAAAYAAIANRDGSWDGRFYVGVATTGIYCRPSCPARTPRQENCQFFPTAAAAVAAGFRACRRCRPDTLPGSRHANTSGDLTGRAVRLIADGTLDTADLPALAQYLAISPRHLTRLLTSEVGATPLQLARARRAYTARLLIEHTPLPLADVAFAAGFGSTRQFDDVMHTEFGTSPRSLGRGTTQPVRTESTDAPTLTLRLRYRQPLDVLALRAALRAHAIDGVDIAGATHLRVIDADRGPAITRLALDGDGDGDGDSALTAHLTLTDLADLTDVHARLRRWLDLDADPIQIDGHLRTDPIVGPLVTARPGLRVPGAVDGAELAVCAVLGQQVSLANARTFQGRIARAFGTLVTLADDGDAPDRDGLTTALVTFPRAEVLSAAGPQAIRDAANLTQARARTVHAIATACADGLRLAPGADPDATRATLLAIPGVGPWTADYLALRALHLPDAFLPSDLVARKALAARTATQLADLTPAVADRTSAPWRPWRSYALQHLWTWAAYAPPSPAGRDHTPGKPR